MAKESSTQGSSIKEIINSSLDQVRAIIDADTVVGKQIVTPSGTMIIPISKVSMGFASGGLDLPTEGDKKNKSFGGGGGTGVTVSPIGFLTVYPDGRVEMLPLVQEKQTPVEQVADIIEHAPDILNRIKTALSSIQFTSKEEDHSEIENAYDEMIDADMTSELSPKELKKLYKQQKKAGK